MKRFTRWAILGFSAFAACAAFADAPAVLAYWPFGESGLSDASGNGNALEGGAAISDCATFAGAAGSVLSTVGVASFTGTSGLAAAPLSVGAYKAFTVEMVFKADNPYSDTQMLIEYGENYQRSGGFYLLVEGNGQVRGGFDGNARIWRRKLNLSKWTHVALVIDSEQTARESQVTLYVNGEKGEIHVVRDDVGVLNGGVSLYLGARNKLSVLFTGAIDDVAISLGARTPDTFILSRPSPLANDANDVIAYWPFNKGRELQDATGNGYSLANSAVTFDSAAAVFNGASTLVTEKMLPFSMQQGLTVECFMQLPAVLGGHVQETVVKTTLGTGASSPGAIKLEFYAAQAPYLMSRWMSGAFKDAGNNTVVLDNVDTSFGTGVTLTDGKWHHVAQVVDPTLPYGALSCLYVDGQEMPQSGSCDADRAQPFWDNVVVVGSDYFTGSIDDLRVTGRALAPAEFLTRRSIPLGMTVILC